MLNKTFFMGHLGRDPEVRHMDNGKAVANFSIATSEYYKDSQGNKQQKTEWVNLVAWSPIAEIVEKYVKKGMLIHVEGKQRTRSYEDKEGVTRYVTEHLIRELKLFPKGSANNNQSATEQSGHATQTASSEVLPEVDDLPF